MNLGDFLAELQLVGTTSAAEIRERVLERQKATPRGTWIMGRGWDQNDWEAKVFPTWRDLAGTEANPVFLRRIDGHAAWLNRTALDSLGITAEALDPYGGRFIRDATGLPTGVLIDRAKDAAALRIPEPPRGEKSRRMRAAIEECQRFGLTGVHDMQTEREDLEILRELADAGALKLRVYTALDTDDSTFVLGALAAGPQVDSGGYVTVRAIKVYADGALGSRGAALLAPYADEPSQRGLIITPPDAMARWARMCLERGFQMCAHAIGDAGNRAVIDAYEHEIGAAAAKNHRFRIEHAQVLDLSDIERIARLGIVASMQPTHATSDMYWAEDRVGSDRIQGAYAWRKLIDAGVVIACGSDFPVEEVNPLWGVYAAVTRQDHSGWPPGGWLPGERMTLEEAVGGFTSGAAFAEFGERDKGMIEEGNLADFTIIDRDIFALPATEILQARVVYTIVGGEIVYAARDSVESAK
jgi:predicted amidohydrolase YtcJ